MLHKHKCYTRTLHRFYSTMKENVVRKESAFNKTTEDDGACVKGVVRIFREEAVFLEQVSQHTQVHLLY